MNMQGTVKVFKPERGFGFLATETAEYFVHFRDVVDHQYLHVGQMVEFEAVPGVPGKYDRAVNVRPF